jgi:predicted TIM-barrel fold metal-dependent hydrolase
MTSPVVVCSRRRETTLTDVPATELSTSEQQSARWNGQLVVDRGWLDLGREEPYAPNRSLVDPHIHLWRGDPLRYTPADYLHDIAGHDLRATVYAQCYTEYLTEGPEHLRPAGEVAFAVSQRAQARGMRPEVDFNGGVVGFAALNVPRVFDEAIAAMVDAGCGRLQGVRPEIYSETGDETLLRDERWKHWAATLHEHDLGLEAWVSYLQLPALAELAGRFPRLAIVVNHIGGAAGAASQGDGDLRRRWLDGLRSLARCENVVVKMGGLGTSVFGYRFFLAAHPPSSEELAVVWRPWFEPVVELFGPKRCMFESNYPVDARVASLGVLWNCFKRLADRYTPEEGAWLCGRTATQSYRL